MYDATTIAKCTFRFNKYEVYPLQRPPFMLGIGPNHFPGLRNYLSKTAQAMDQLYVGPIGSNDPFAPVNIKETCAELNQENSELAQRWKNSAMTEWKSSKDKALHLSRLLFSRIFSSLCVVKHPAHSKYTS